MNAELERLHDDGVLEDLDLHFARLIDRLDGGGAREVALAAALVSHATGEGHVCLDLAAVAGQPLAPDARDAPVAPTLAAWHTALAASRVVGEPGSARPLVLDAHGRLYLHRYWEYEQRLAASLRERAAAGVAGVDRARLATDLDALVAPAGDAAAPDWQRVAAAVAVLRRLCIVSGGPGTGKTTTVVRILALLAAQPGPPLRLHLAAPTGKAAARLQEAVRLAKERLPLAPAVRDAIPDRATTLHRLLGAMPGTIAFRHDRTRPLPIDVLVIDEASMVDLALMAKVVDALPDSARLVLLGDRDQLASVEAGAVLADICGPAPGLSRDFAAEVAALTREPLPAGEPRGAAPSGGAFGGAALSGGAVGGAALSGGAVNDPGPLRDTIVLLARSHRFAPESGIGRLAEAVKRGDGEAALALLEGGTTDLGWRTIDSAAALRAAVGDEVLAHCREYLDVVAAGAPPAAVFAALARFRVLCAHRTGPVGAETLNRLIEDVLEGRGLVRRRDGWYPGRPVMVTRNDYALRVFNGDVGVALPEAGGSDRLQVVFEATEGNVRAVARARLPPHESVWAMTVHKSQGSEFERVLLVLPPEPSRVTTRELLYTAVTRAREQVRVWGTAAVLRAAATRRLERSSGLRDALWSA